MLQPEQSKIENIDNLQVSEHAVQFGINWLTKKNGILRSADLSELVKYLLVEINELTKQVKELQNK